MSDSATFTCPEFLELEPAILSEFMTCYADAKDEISTCLIALQQSHLDKDINQLFRAMHSLKGNCRMVYLEPYVDLLHAMEEIVARLRSHHCAYETWIGEFIASATEEIEIQIKELVSTHKGSQKRLHWLRELVNRVENATENDRKPTYLQATAELRGDITQAATADKHTLPELPDDLSLMQGLAQMLDGLSIYRRGRSEQLLQLSKMLNESLNSPVPEDQLVAAVFMHDVGMALTPHNIFNKEGTLTKEELRLIQSHVNVGYQLLQRFGGWDEAAAIVMQHHERFDGSGYPSRLCGEAIHIGARILSIVDTYCSITNERSDRNFKKSLLSAVSEINANKGTQFDPHLVNAFNDVVRTHLLKPASAA